MHVTRHNAWRHRVIILPRELALALHEVHGGQSSAVYALASTGSHHLVSLSMIDAAAVELARVRVHTDNREVAEEVLDVENALEEVRIFWREHSAKEHGLDETDQGYDHHDYGMTEAEERKIPTRSG